MRGDLDESGGVVCGLVVGAVCAVAFEGLSGRKDLVATSVREGDLQLIKHPLRFIDE
jgi:hypothetical protein